MTVLIQGLGSIASKHIAVLRRLCPELRIIALRSGFSNKVIEGVESIWNLDEVRVSIDFVIISNPTSLHFESIQRLKNLGVPLFIEKPVLGSLVNADNLEQELHSLGIKTYVACNLRFHPAIIYLKEVLKDKKPLEFNVYCGSFLPHWRPSTDYRESYSSKKEFGGGVELDLIHEVDYTVYLLGMPKQVLFKHGTKISDLQITSNDYAHYVFDHLDTVTTVSLNYYRKHSKRSIEVVWDDDVWIVNLLNNTIHSESKGVIYNEHYDIMNTYNHQMEYFLNNFQSNSEFENNFSEAIKILKLAI